VSGFRSASASPCLRIAAPSHSGGTISCLAAEALENANPVSRYLSWNRPKNVNERITLFISVETPVLTSENTIRLAGGDRPESDIRGSQVVIDLCRQQRWYCDEEIVDFGLPNLSESR
jgi:hypothetical protein